MSGSESLFKSVLTIHYSLSLLVVTPQVPLDIPIASCHTAIVIVLLSFIKSMYHCEHNIETT